MKNLLMLLGCSLLLSCTSENTKEKSKLDKVAWVVGEWKLETPDGTFTEIWKKDSDSSYAGSGALTSTSGEVLFSETLRLVQRGNDLWYVPTIASQNNGQPVYFKEKSLTEDEVVFENPEHDFPQRIIYQRLADTGMYARIEGRQNGQEAKEEYTFKKSK